MSSACVAYILFNIRQSLGNDVESICRYLLNNESCTMRQILKEFKHIQPNNVSEYLKALIDMNFVCFNFTENNIDSYEFDIEGFLAYNRSARFLSIIEKNYGEISRVICYCLLLYGNISVCEIIKRSQQYSNMQGNFAKVIGVGINDLVRYGVLEGAPMFLFENRGILEDVFTDVDKITEHFSTDIQSEIVRKRKLSGTESEQNLWNKHYCINRNVLNQLCKYEIIAEDARCTLGQSAGFVMGIFLRQIHSLNTARCNDPMSMSLLLRKVRAVQLDFDEELFKDCIYLLANDSQVTYIEEVRHLDEILLLFNDDEVTKQMAIKHLTELVKANFGQSGLIIFNRVLSNPYVDESALSNNVMMSPDHLNSILPRMVNLGFVSRLELSKSKQYFDEPLTSLLFIDVDALVRIEQETCYQCLRNLAVRRLYEEQREKPLLTKVYALSVAEGTQAQDDEILVVTDSDRKTLSGIANGLFKLSVAESSVVSSLIIFESNIKIQNQSATL